MCKTKIYYTWVPDVPKSSHPYCFLTRLIQSVRQPESNNGQSILHISVEFTGMLFEGGAGESCFVGKQAFNQSNGIMRDQPSCVPAVLGVACWI